MMDDMITMTVENGATGNQTSSPDPWQVWAKRWQALEDAMSHLNNLIVTIPASPAQEEQLRRGALQTLIQKLQLFVGAGESEAIALSKEEYAGLFTFLFYNLTADRLVLPEVYPPEYVLRILLDQIGFDLNLISTAAAQRLYATGTMAQRFCLADALAQAAIQPAIAAGLLPEGTIALTFMANGARARVIPYAAVALIAIPFTAAAADEDLLATAHEAGHYVYWHGELGAPSLNERLIAAGVPSWCRQWTEEIFADVYGTVVAGAPYALSGQDILLDERLDMFWHDDGEHPVAPLRPRLYGKVLAKKGGQNAAWRQPLQERWEQKEAEIQHRMETVSSKEANRSATLRPRKHGNIFEKQPLAETMDWQQDTFADAPGVGDWPLDKALSVIYNILAQSKNGSTSVLAAAQGWLGTHKSYPVNSDVQQLYKAFTDYLAKLTTPVSDIILSNTSSEERLLVIKRKLLRDAAAVTPTEWEYLISVQGWVTRGPQEQPNPPE